MKLKAITAAFISIFTAIILIVSSGAVNIPDPSSEFYVYDAADVISDSVKDIVISKNTRLAYATGAEIVIATVDSTEGESISTFAGEMFAKWAIGDSSKKNGVLVLLAIEDDNYWVVQGSGISSSLSSAKIKNLIDTYLEPSFAAKDYSTGVSALFSKLCDEVAAIYEIKLDEVNVPENSIPAKKSGGASPLAVIGIILAVVAVLAAVALVVRYFLLPGQYRSNRRPKISLAPGGNYSLPPARHPSSAGMKTNPSSGARPSAPNTARSGAPAGVRPNLSTNPGPNVRNGARPNAPAGMRPNAPAGARPNVPAGARPNAPASARPNAPAGARPNAPASARPNAPAGMRPNAPAGARPNVPAGARPGSTYTGNNRPRQ